MLVSDLHGDCHLLLCFGQLDNKKKSFYFCFRWGLFLQLLHVLSVINVQHRWLTPLAAWKTVQLQDRGQCFFHFPETGEESSAGFRFWPCEVTELFLSPVTNSTGQDRGDGDDQQPPGQAAGEDEGQQDSTAGPAIGRLPCSPGPARKDWSFVHSDPFQDCLSFVVKIATFVFYNLWENETGLNLHEWTLWILLVVWF